MAATGWRGTSSVTMALAVRATCRLYSWSVGVRRGELIGVEWSWCARVDVSIQLAVVECGSCRCPNPTGKSYFSFSFVEFVLRRGYWPLLFRCAHFGLIFFLI